MKTYKNIQKYTSPPPTQTVRRYCKKMAPKSSKIMKEFIHSVFFDLVILWARGKVRTYERFLGGRVL